MDGYRDQIVTCDVGVSLHSKTHPLFIQYNNGGQAHSVMHTSISDDVSCVFLQSIYVPFNSKI